MAQMDRPVESSNPETPARRPLRVLIAEDNKVLRLMIAKMLQVSGYDVSACGDGQEAIQLIERNPFDLVITDLMMPGATGIEVLRASRKAQPRSMVVMMTGSPSPQTLLEAKREGAYAYLRKPFNLKQFLSVLQSAAEHMAPADSQHLGSGKENPQNHHKKHVLLLDF